MKLQPILESDLVYLRPLESEDFENLYAVASDPFIWEQHPNKDRYKREVFETFFRGAMLSKGAFLIFDKASEKAIGSTRFYDFDETANSIFIGYTFYARAFWGRNYNATVKKLMLDYIFSFVENVRFHVGKENVRSRKAMEKLGAKLIGEEIVAYFGEPDRVNVVYSIAKTDWKS